MGDLIGWRLGEAGSKDGMWMGEEKAFHGLCLASVARTGRVDFAGSGHEPCCRDGGVR